ALLPDGRVLVGGHSPIPTGYGAPQTLPGGFSDNFRDPSFEIYSPPYLFWGPRPVITAAPDDVTWGDTFKIHTPDAGRIGSVVLVRNTALTHLADDHRPDVALPMASRTQQALQLTP